jgi:hypothetical protein
MKTIIAAAVISVALVCPARGDAYLSLGSAGDLIPDDPTVFAPDLRLAAGGNLYAPLSDEWSMFLSGAFLQCWRPLDARWRYLYSAAYDASLRSGDFLFKAGLKARGEQLFTAGFGWPDRFDNAFELHAAYDIGNTTLFLTPQLAFTREDFLGDNLLVRGEAGLTFLLSERFVGTAKLKGSVTLVDLDSRTAIFGGELGLSHYPDAPVSLVLTLGAFVQDSDYSEIMVATPVERLDFTQVYALGELSFSLGDALLVKVTLPARLSFKTMHAIRHGAFTDEREWTLAVAPEIEATVRLAEEHALVVLIKAEPFFSNSDYHDAGYGECSVSYRLSF